jgi:hypothetical protein
MEENYSLMMAFNHSAHVKNMLACKEKWMRLYIMYKQIRDYTIGTRHNKEFWNMFIVN